MKAYKKVYGVNDMTHWNAILKCGSNGNTMRVEFTGGAATANGARPAIFATTNPITQMLIESSDYFKRGKIILYRQYELSTPLKGLGTPKGEEKKKAETSENVAPESETPKESNGSETQATIVNVANIEEEGRNYLCDNFGYKHAQLRSKTLIEQCAKKHNIKFVLPTD